MTLPQFSFLFFGCSWTYGRFINLSGHPENPPKDYNEQEQADMHSYRALVANHFSAKHTNFSIGGSSNGRQLRLAAQHFIGPHSYSSRILKKLAMQYNSVRDPSWPTIDELAKKPQLPLHILDELLTVHKIDDFEFLRPDGRIPVVLWFITSTARKEFYSSVNGAWENHMLGDGSSQSPVARLYLSDCYDHAKELEQLGQQMQLWNSFFASQGIQNFWIDTFNHHEYPVKVDNQLSFDTEFSDLMSNLCIITGYTPTHDQYHYSEWTVDDNRSKHLVDLGLLNKISLHPTQQGHKMIAEKLLIPRLESMLGKNTCNKITL